MSGDVVIIDDKSAPLPISSYGKTKFTAEQKLLKMALGSKVELVIIRPPMIIGRGAPGNLDRLMRLLRSPIPFPLPIGNVHRSFITIESLARFCDCVLDKKHSLEPLIANLASTPTVTLSELVKSLRLGLGVRMINIVFPKFILAWAMRILGLSETYQKVFSSLLIKPSSAAIDMGWSPHEDWRAVFIKIGEDAKSDERRNKIRNE